jgi:hypothetical protein
MVAIAVVSTLVFEVHLMIIIVTTTSTTTTITIITIITATILTTTAAVGMHNSSCLYPERIRFFE